MLIVTAVLGELTETVLGKKAASKSFSREEFQEAAFAFRALTNFKPIA